jgi:hypothetical protein
MNKVLGTSLTKLVSENKTDWDEHLSTLLFSYKIAIGYTPYQLMYGLHPLMPIKYIVPVVGGNEKDNTPTKVLTNKTIKLKKLQEIKMLVAEIARI